LSNGTLEIKGFDLAAVDTVRIEGSSTINLSVVSKTFDTVIAQVQQSVSVLLGGAYSLIVSSAFGQASTSLSVELTAGSVRPEHLDLNLDWPFPTPKILGLDSTVTIPGVTPVSEGTISNLTDSVQTTYARFDLLAQASGTCDNTFGDPNYPGRYVWSLRDGIQKFSGTIKLLSSSSGGTTTIDIQSAESLSALSSDITTHMGYTGYSTAPTWSTLNFSNASHIVLKLKCDYTGQGNHVKIYEIKAAAQPAN
jgi:hypothetical protein